MSDMSPGTNLPPMGMGPGQRYRPLWVWEGPKHGWYFDGWLWTDEATAYMLRELESFASVAHLGN